jgi:ribonuclease D
LPQTGIPNHRIWANRFPEADARLKSVRAALTALAQELNLPIENLLTPDFVRQVCWEPPVPATAEAIASLLGQLGARAWQIEKCSHVISKSLEIAGTAEAEEATAAESPESPES